MGTDLPYHRQGDSAYETPELLAKREALRLSPKLKNVALLFWKTLGKEPSESITFPEYFQVHRLISRALAPELAEDEAVEAPEEAWAEDILNSKGCLTSTRIGRHGVLIILWSVRRFFGRRKIFRVSFSLIARGMLLFLFDVSVGSDLLLLLRGSVLLLSRLEIFVLLRHRRSSIKNPSNSSPRPRACHPAPAPLARGATTTISGHRREGHHVTLAASYTESRVHNSASFSPRRIICCG